MTSALVFSVTSMTNSWLAARHWWRMSRSTVAPTLSMLEMKQSCLASARNQSSSPLSEKAV